MVRMRLIAILILLPLAAPAFAGDLTDAQREQQQELLEWVRTLRYQARTDQALNVCEMILATDPECIDAWLERGLLTLAAGDLAEATQCFEEALDSDGDNPMALVGRAHAYLLSEDFEQAEQDATKALETCRKRIVNDRGNAETYYASGLAKMLLGNGSALQDFVMAVSLDPAHIDARTERAQVYRAGGRLDDALSELTRAVEVRPDYAVGYLARARIHYETENLQEAVADCDRALEINPQYARAWHNRGLVSLERGHLKTAIDNLTRAISADPEYASAHFYRGQAHLASGDETAARADWEATRELAQDGWAGRAAQKALSELGQAQ